MNKLDLVFSAAGAGDAATSPSNNFVVKIEIWAKLIKFGQN